MKLFNILLVSFVKVTEPLHRANTTYKHEFFRCCLYSGKAKLISAHYQMYLRKEKFNLICPMFLTLIWACFGLIPKMKSTSCNHATVLTRRLVKVFGKAVCFY